MHFMLWSVGRGGGERQIYSLALSVSVRERCREIDVGARVAFVVTLGRTRNKWVVPPKTDLACRVGAEGELPPSPAILCHQCLAARDAVAHAHAHSSILSP